MGSHDSKLSKKEGGMLLYNTQVWVSFISFSRILETNRSLGTSQNVATARERIRNNYQKYYQLTFFLDPGTLDAVTKMIRFEGLAGFYKGMNTKIVQSVVAAAVLFMIKEELVKAARTLVTVQPKAPRLRL